MAYLESHVEDVNWTTICKNPLAEPLLLKHPETMAHWCWEWLSENPGMVTLLTMHPGKIKWKRLSSNPNAMALVEANKSLICWSTLSMNPSAVPFLTKHMEEVDLEQFSRNEQAIPFLEAHPHFIHWKALSTNPAAVHLFHQYADKIDWTLAAVHMQHSESAQNLSCK